MRNGTATGKHIHRKPDITRNQNSPVTWEKKLIVTEQRLVKYGTEQRGVEAEGFQDIVRYIVPPTEQKWTSTEASKSFSGSTFFHSAKNDLIHFSSVAHPLPSSRSENSGSNHKKNRLWGIW